MQAFYVGSHVPAFSILEHVMRSYLRWDEENFPQQEARCVLSS